MANTHRGIPRARISAGQLRRHRSGSTVLSEWLWLVRHGGECVAVANDWYRPDYYQQIAAGGGIARNPKDRAPRSIRLSPASPNGPCEVVRFSVQTSAASATWSELAEKVRLVPAPRRFPMRDDARAVDKDLNAIGTAHSGTWRKN